MTTKERCKGYCMEMLQSLQLEHIYNHAEFERMYKGSSQLNPFITGTTIADNLIRIENFKIHNHERRNEA